MKTGGLQPTEVDERKINHFFTGNYAKSWAMRDGFISTFKEYKDGKIIFDMTTDPRFKGNGFFLSKWIAEQYKSNVDVLKDAKSYQANHFIALEQIGFLVNADTDAATIEELNRKCKYAYASLPAKPSLLHFGSIK